MRGIAGFFVLGLLIIVVLSFCSGIDLIAGALLSLFQ